jgi:hypothetical protein
MLTNRLSTFILLLLPFGNFFSLTLGSLYTLSFFSSLLLFAVRFTRGFLFSFVFLLLFALIAIFVSHDQYFEIPWARIVSSCIFIAPLLSSILSRKSLSNNMKPNLLLRCFTIARLVSFLSALAALAVSLLYKSRPNLLFDEPTRLGLFFVSVSIAYLYINLSSHLDKQIFHNQPSWIEVIIIFCASISTRTTHIILIFPVLATLLLPRLSKSLASMRLSQKLVSIVISMLALSAVFYALCLAFISEFYGRVNSILLGPSSTNLSSLSWLRGFSAIKYTFDSSTLFGFGIGSMGHTRNVNELSQAIDLQFRSLSSSILNIYDGYSLLFRLAHDLGFVLTPFLVLSVIYKFTTAIASYSSPLPNPTLPSLANISDVRIAMIFYKVLGLSLFFGALFKEPILTSFPFVYVPFLLVL